MSHAFCFIALAPQIWSDQTNGGGVRFDGKILAARSMFHVELPGLNDCGLFALLQRP
jgi:hypothetical protein